MPLLLDPDKLPRAPSLLVLARHGLSLTNALRYTRMYLPEDADTSELSAYNDLSVPLMPEGHAQASALGRILRDQFGTFDVVCFSAHRRSVQTKDGVITDNRLGHSITLYQHSFFNERDNGYFFGKKLSELETAYGKAFMDAHRVYWRRTGWFNARPFGGESIADLVNGRTYHALRMLGELFGDKRVLVIGHGTWIRAARVLLERQRTDTLEPTFEGLGNCGYVVYEPYASRSLVLTQYQYDTEYVHRPIPPD